jgi:hypothetical protein
MEPRQVWEWADAIPEYNEVPSDELFDLLERRKASVKMLTVLQKLTVRAGVVLSTPVYTLLAEQLSTLLMPQWVFGNIQTDLALIIIPDVHYCMAGSRRHQCRRVAV